MPIQRFWLLIFIPLAYFAKRVLIILIEHIFQTFDLLNYGKLNSNKILFHRIIRFKKKFYFVFFIRYSCYRTNTIHNKHWLRQLKFHFQQTYHIFLYHTFSISVSLTNNKGRSIRWVYFCKEDDCCVIRLCGE